jgi:hypothetical protein
MKVRLNEHKKRAARGSKENEESAISDRERRAERRRKRK